MTHRRLLGGGLVAACALALALASSVRAQSFEAMPDTGRITVGDPVAVRLLLRQYEGDALLESTPHPIAALASGVKLLAVDSMRSIGNRLLEAHARLVFYRPGPQTIPTFAIDFRRGAVILHGTMRTDPVPIVIVPVLGAAGGGPTLRDIRELVEVPGPDPRVVAIVAAILALSVWVLRRRGRLVMVPAPALAAVEAGPDPAPDAFALALYRLSEIERTGWVTSAELARHYAAVTDALRDYLETAEALPARERTSSELLWTLPPHLAEDELRVAAATMFDESDLVKFARRRPDAAAAAAFLAQARALLTRWRAAVPSPGVEAIDAVR